MRKAKTINEKVFDNLSREQQQKELKKMTKRANVRLSLLEESGVINGVYNEADLYNFKEGRNKNRFYEGTNYKTSQDIKSAYTAVSNFLNNKLSTLSGIEKQTTDKVDKLIANGQFDMNTLRRMSDKELIYASKELSKQGNKQLKKLEKAGIDTFAYSVAGQYNEATGRKNNRFYTGGKFSTTADIKTHIQNVSTFLNSKTATPRGYVDTIKNRINTFREKGIKIGDDYKKLNISNKDEQDFIDFLSSEQFTSLKKYADSNQILDLFVDARNANVDVARIQEEFENYKNTNMDLDDVRDKLVKAKWKKGGLLK